MLDTTNLAIALLVAHALHGGEVQRELQIALATAVAHSSANHSQKQIALLVVLEELMKGLPPDYQPANTLAVISTLLFGTRTLAAVSQIARGGMIEDA
jgi:hypothetical protein